MFPSKVYSERRASLRKILKNGLVLFPANIEMPYNYPANTFHYRQDSNFSYFFGLNQPSLTAVMDLDEGSDYLFGNDIDMEDIIWMGHLPSIKERALTVGVTLTKTLNDLPDFISKAIQSKRKIHYLPCYHAETTHSISKLLNLSFEETNRNFSVDLIKSVVQLRSVKDSYEIAEIEKMIDVAWQMHTTAMRMCKPGILESEIAGVIEGIALSHGNGVSFPIILSMNGETLHNHNHGNILQKGRLVITDAGAESELLYASDITRTTPVGGSFSAQQKEIYQIVLDANLKAIELSSPQTFYRDVHFASAKTITEGLKSVGLMKGNTDDIVAAGAHALFFPHGLGHQMGLDVHDMEGLGENYVGYNDDVKRSGLFGTAYLRFARKPEPNYVLTVEPGIYFIPALIDLWRSEKKFTDFIDYDKVEKYKGFGGIRIEDDILITEKGCKVMGKSIPKTIAEVEAAAQ